MQATTQPIHKNGRNIKSALFNLLILWTILENAKIFMNAPTSFDIYNNIRKDMFSILL